MKDYTDGVNDRDQAGVDVTLVDACLALTPEQRLLQNDRVIATIQELRDGFEDSRADQPAD